jgi:hypothetical protein
MGKLRLILGLLLVVLVIVIVWQVASCELANAALVLTGGVDDGVAELVIGAQGN